MQLTAQHTGPATRGFVSPYTPAPLPFWYLGLDLGQRRDHSALAILQLLWTPLGRCATTYQYLFQPELVIRSLERYPLNTSYEEVPRIVQLRAQQINDRHRASNPHTHASMELVIDAGGPGGPMVDHLRRVAPFNLTVSPVFITAGKGESRLAGGYAGVPRRALVTQVVQMVSCGNLSCPKNLPGFPAWMHEMLSLSGCATQPATAGDHDDLTLATALAAWAAVRDNVELAPGASSDKDQCKYGYIDKPLF